MARKKPEGTRWLGALLLLVFSAATPAIAQQTPAPGRAPTIAEAEAMEARLRAAIQVNPNVGSLHANLGELLRSQARIAESRDAFAEAVRLEPLNADFRIALARAHLSLNEYVEAEVNYGYATELEPNNPRAFGGLASALIGQDRPGEAVTALQRALALDPGNPDYEALLAGLRSAPTPAEEDAAPMSVPGIIATVLTWFFAIALVIAGVGLLLPVAASVFVLVAYLPLALLRRGRT